MTDVVTPNGKRYRVQIRPDLPEYIHPISGVADLAGDALPALVGVVAAAIGSKLRIRVGDADTGWTIDVVRHETRWRSAKVIHSETLNESDAVVERAYELGAMIRQGVSRLNW
jgi:hypothetical protein